MSNGRFDGVENTPGFPDHNQQTNKSYKQYSDQFGRDDMIFESQELCVNERKSLDYCNSKKLINSAKRLKAPTP